MTTVERILGTRQFTGWHMVAVLGLFFGTVIGVNLTLAWFANSSWTGLVVKNSYVESQRFNEVTAERRRQALLEWTGAFSYEDGMLSLALTERTGIVVGGATVTARLGRPATAAEDHVVTLAAEGLSYRAADRLKPGIWEAQVAVIGRDGEVWTRAYRFMVKG